MSLFISNTALQIALHLSLAQNLRNKEYASWLPLCHFLSSEAPSLPFLSKYSFIFLLLKSLLFLSPTPFSHYSMPAWSVCFSSPHFSMHFCWASSVFVNACTLVPFCTTSSFTRCGFPVKRWARLPEGENTMLQRLKVNDKKRVWDVVAFRAQKFQHRTQLFSLICTTHSLDQKNPNLLASLLQKVSATMEQVLFLTSRCKKQS